MSSRKAAVAKATRPAAKAVVAKAAAAKPVDAKQNAAKAVDGKPGAVKQTGKPAADVTASAAAMQLAAKIEHDLREGRLDTLTPHAFQTLMAALCRSYGTQLEAGADFLPVADR